MAKPAATRDAATNPFLRISWRRLGAYALVLMLVSYGLLPMYWMLISAIRPVEELLTRFPAWAPGGIDLSRFLDIWSSIPLGWYMANSAIVVVLTVVIAVAAAGIGGYALSRFDFPGAGVIIVVILFTQAIPAVVVLLPFYTMLHDLGLVDTRVALPLSYTVWAVPMATLILRGYFKTAVPREIEEAALVDGCTRLSVLWRVVLPLALPGLLSAAMLIGVMAWNEFLWASLVSSEESVRTVAVGLHSYVGRFGANEQLPMWMAGAVFISLPPILLYIFAHRYVAVGYGAVDK
jgi:ABC-type glycerol-3-phosphate transport system permease component